MVEPNRRHGSFDPRYPALAKPEAPSWILYVDGDLDWTEFTARYFPDRDRHNIEALAAYGAYRTGLSHRSTHASDTLQKNHGLQHEGKPTAATPAPTKEVAAISIDDRPRVAGRFSLAAGTRIEARHASGPRRGRT
jgi:hypothetical protein